MLRLAVPSSPTRVSGTLLFLLSSSLEKKKESNGELIYNSKERYETLGKSEPSRDSGSAIATETSERLPRIKRLRLLHESTSH